MYLESDKKKENKGVRKFDNENSIYNLLIIITREILL